QGLPPKYGGHCRNLSEPPKGKEPQVIRFKMPEVKVEFKDVIRGTVAFDASLFGDIAIAKDIKSPFHHLAVVVDDEEMRVSHVIRGEDLLSNTPRQILLQRALGFREPTYAHLPLILNADRSKLSKRFAETSLLDYKRQGYLPEAVVNFCAFLGWHPKGDREVFSPDELIGEFDLKRVQKAGAVFDVKKLEWLQKKHLEKLSDKEIVNKLRPVLEAAGITTTTKAFLTNVVSVERERITTFGDFADTAGFFFQLPEYQPTLLAWQKEDLSKVKIVLEKTAKILDGLEEFKKNTIGEALAPLIEQEGRGSVFWPLRAALSGLPASPDPMEIAEILGKKEVLRRLGIAIEKLRNV
ncbi:MAG: glutamate--tRNA ligase, partial [Candidatus Sungbacteria bacterium]|nr:glutamate--tRNA ligase [Candidatus Sungbacteria bacterium]